MEAIAELKSQLAEVEAKRAEIAAEIESKTKEKREQDLADVLRLIAEHRFTAVDLRFVAPASAPKGKRVSKLKGTKAPVKYSDGNGHSWSGRGRTPAWLEAKMAAGAAKEQFLVA